VTDGTSFWVVDGSRLKVFKYTLSGSSLGSWAIDPANTHPTGLTINPASVSDVWIVDSGTLRVYQYVGAASRTSGSQNAAASFALAPGDTNPQGIADPPTADMVRTSAAAPTPPELPSTAAAGPSLASRDAAFTLLARASLQRPDESSVAMTVRGAQTAALHHPTPAEDRAGPSAGAPLAASPPGGIRHALRPNPRAVGLMPSVLVDEESLAPAPALDAFFAIAADETPVKG
jgi:hypothetical protein